MLGAVAGNGYGLTMAPVSGSTATISGAISGSGGNDLISVAGGGPNSTGGSLFMNGAGVLILTGNNTYTGATIIQQGTLQVGSGTTSSSLGNGTGAIGFASGGTPTLTSGYTTSALAISNPIYLAYGSTIGGINPITFSGNAIVTSTTNIGNAATVTGAANVLFNFTGSFSQSGYVNVNNFATLQLGGASTAGGNYNMTVNTGGTLNINNVNALGSTSANSPAQISDFGTVNMNLSGATLADTTTTIGLAGWYVKWQCYFK